MISPYVAALADSALLLPASLLLGLFLLATRRWRLALAWAAGLGLAGGATLAAKLLFHACGRSFGDLDVTSPSGHVCFAVVFYGGLAMLFGLGRSTTLRGAAAGGVFLLVIGVAISRVRTEAHTVPEVAIGLAIGALALGLLVAIAGRDGGPALPWRVPLAGFALALVLLFGRHVGAERLIGGWARDIQARFDICREPDR